MAIPPTNLCCKKRGCRVTGFEPQVEALAMLNKLKSDLETYLPNVIGDGNPATLRICRAPGMTSLYKPDTRMLAHFCGFPGMGNRRFRNFGFDNPTRRRDRRGCARFSKDRHSGQRVDRN